MCDHNFFFGQAVRDNPVRQGEIEQSFQSDGWKTEAIAEQGPVFIWAGP